jgi:hypothetical protein
MRSARKLRSVNVADEPKLLQGRSVEGVVTGLNPDGQAVFHGENGEVTEARVPLAAQPHAQYHGGSCDYWR